MAIEFGEQKGQTSNANFRRIRVMYFKRTGNNEPMIFSDPNSIFRSGWNLKPTPRGRVKLWWQQAGESGESRAYFTVKGWAIDSRYANTCRRMLFCIEIVRRFPIEIGFVEINVVMFRHRKNVSTSLLSRI